MRPLVVAATAAVLATAGLRAAPPAAAECAMPRPAVFPAGGALPPHPTLYRFEPAYTPVATLRVAGRDGPVPFTTRDVSATGDLRVTAIHIDADAGPIAIHGGDGERVYRYELIAQAAPAAPLAAPVAARVAREQSAWTCSHTDGIAIELMAPGVAAVRARWSDGTEAVVAPDRHAYFTGPDAPLWAGQLRVFLGHPSCVGDQIPTRYIGRRDFTLTAIYTDGGTHEIVLPRGPATAADDDAADDAADDDNDATNDDRSTATATPAAAPARPAPARDHPRTAIAGVAIGALALLLALLRVRRRHRRAHV